MKHLLFKRFVFIFISTMVITNSSFATERIPLSSQITSEFAGEGGDIAINSVVRIICPNTRSSGTGFLHKSGKIITAQHVIENCINAVVLNSKGELRQVVNIVSDNVIDLAMLDLNKEYNYKAFNITLNDNLVVGLQVSTWGYPNGYRGFAPLLSVGYVSGVDQFRT